MSPWLKNKNQIPRVIESEQIKPHDEGLCPHVILAIKTSQAKKRNPMGMSLQLLNKNQAIQKRYSGTLFARLRTTI